MLGLTVTGSGGNGIEIQEGSGNSIEGSTIGWNGGHGVFLSGGTRGTLVGGNPPGLLVETNNLIYQNRGSGIRVGSSLQDTAARANAININLIGWNFGAGIDLGGDCQTINDIGDLDSGPNDLLNAPAISSATLQSDGKAAITGSYSGLPNASFTLQFYANPNLPVGSLAQGEHYLGSTTVTTDGSGQATFDVVLEPLLSYKPFPSNLGTVVATAQDQAGNTSEFSGPAFVPLPTNLSFYALEPCRALDTRVGAGAPLGGPALDGPRAFRMVGVCGIPETARALTVNATVVSPSGAGYVAFSPLTCLPNTSTINFSPSQTRANNAVVTLNSAGQIVAHPVVLNQGTVDLLLDVTGYYQ